MNWWFSRSGEIMGWSGGDEILTAVNKASKKAGISDSQRYTILKALVDALGDQDWDTWWMEKQSADAVIWRIYCEFYNLDENGDEK